MACVIDCGGYILYFHLSSLIDYGTIICTVTDIAVSRASERPVMADGVRGRLGSQETEGAGVRWRRGARSTARDTTPTIFVNTPTITIAVCMCRLLFTTFRENAICIAICFMLCGCMRETGNANGQGFTAAGIAATRQQAYE